MPQATRKMLTFGDEGYAWLYFGLALLVLGKVLAVFGMLLLVTFILGQPVLPMMLLFTAALITILLGVAANFRGLTLVTNRTQRKIVLGDTRMCMGMPWGLKTLRYEEIDGIYDEPGPIRIELTSGQSALIPDRYFKTPAQRSSFLLEIRRRTAKAHSLREPALFG